MGEVEGREGERGGGSSSSLLAAAVRMVSGAFGSISNVPNISLCGETFTSGAVGLAGDALV